MKHMLLILALICGAVLLSPPAQAAECYADYKAKQDNPLRLHYGVMALGGPCNKAAARAEIASRLRAAGWTLLSVQSVFGPEGLQARKSDAGPYFLSF